MRSRTSKAEEYLYKNLATFLWSTLLALGGAIFIAYYLYIGYMPELDLKSSVTITATAAITAVVLTGILLLVMVMPGVGWAHVIREYRPLKGLWTSPNEGTTRSGVLLWFAAPLMIAYVAVSSAYWIGGYALSIVFAAVLFYYLYIRRRTASGWIISAGHTAVFVSGSSLCALAAFAPFFLLLKLALQGETEVGVPSWLAAMVVGAVILVVNAVAATIDKKTKAIWYLLLAAYPLFVLLSLFGLFHRLPVTVMELYKFGNIEASRMVLQREACDSIALLNLEPSNAENSKCLFIDSGDSLCYFDQILIRSRLGEEFYLACDLGDATISFTIPSAQVLTWSTQKANKIESSLEQ